MTDDARLQRWLDSRRAAYPSAAHVDVDTLAQYAAGQLSPAKARMVQEHLEACEDGRCGEFVRARAADVELGDPIDHGEPEAERFRARTFQSRAIVWSTFESLARELEVPIDELVNDAMAAYANVRGYVVAAPAPSPRDQPRKAPAARMPMSPSSREDDGDLLEETHDAPSESAVDRLYSPSPRTSGGLADDDLARTAARGALVRPAAGRLPASWGEGPDSRTTPRKKAPLPPPPVPAAAPSRPDSASSRGVPPPARSSGSLPPLAPPPRTVSPAAQRSFDAPRESSSPSASVGRRLVLDYRGRAHSVDKERFLIGRSKTQADLRLDDPNVSRQHAVIERVGAAFYIVDLGSTNGVEVAGERVARRALSDGDVIVITTHEIRCTLR